MLKSEELKAKLVELKAKAEGLEKADEIKASIEEIKDLKAQIELAEMQEAEDKAEIENKINAGKLEKVEGREEDKIMNKVAEIRGSEAYAKGFYNTIRGVELNAEEKDALKAVNVIGTSGVPVPKSFQNKLIQKLEEMNIMRKLGTVITTETDTDIPFVATKGNADWTDENAAYNESDDTFDVITISAYKLTRLLKVSEEILADNTFDLEGYLVDSFARAIAKPEENAFISGDGVKKPAGVFVGAEVGVTANSGTAITADEIIDLYYSLPRAYRQNATFIMNDSTMKAVRKLKDSNGDYLVSKGLGEEPERLLGRPVETSEFAPEIALDAKVIAFGDMSFYTIGDRGTRQFQRLNELYSANGQVGFRGYERVDGKLTLSESVKVLQMAAV